MNASNGLPQRIDPYRLANVDGVVEGECAIAGMPRLKAYLFQDDNATQATENATIQVIMRFSRKKQRRVIIEGELTGHLVLQCQRCLLGLDWPVKAHIELAVVADDDAAEQVPREYEPLIVGEEGISPIELVEDELILAMPTVARCETINCPNTPKELSTGKTSKNPFAVLRELDFGNDDQTTD